MSNREYAERGDNKQMVAGESKAMRRMQRQKTCSNKKVNRHKNMNAAVKNKREYLIMQSLETAV